nr:TerB N-terminal domain-containing protein [Advenella kashmirensis]
MVPTPRTAPGDDDEPISIAHSLESVPSSFRVPVAPQNYSQTKWIPAGETVIIAGISIPGGLLYVGRTLLTASRNNDPALIDPSKPVAKYGNYAERQMGYWPSYSEISPIARRAYLNWLADGRMDPAADIGYVFLFLYGLERRAILDASKEDAAKADWPIIAVELRRLLGIYGEKSGSFRNYAGSLLDWVSVSECPEKAYLKPIPSFPKTYELPLYIRVALGQTAVDKVPVPAPLALVWVKLDPTIYLRTPATRCPEEFDRIFVCRYYETFGEGLILPKNRTRLKMVHRPASAGFHGYNDVSLTFGDIPDVTALTAPINKLQKVVETATKDLEPFSRYVGKNPNDRYSLEGLVLLPVKLWPESTQEILFALKKRMDNGVVTMSFQDLLASLGARATFTRDRTLALLRALESLNIGVEPDVLGGAKQPKPDEDVVLFAVSSAGATDRSAPAYQVAVLTLDLASGVAAADGQFNIEEMDHLEKQVQTWTHLTPYHISRLLAHLHLLRKTQISLSVLKKKIEPLNPSAKEAIAAFMATVAQSDGHISPTEVKMLEKVYRVLGIEAAKMFTDVHAVAAGAKPALITVAEVERTGFKLDPARIAALQKDTEVVSALLSGIFNENNLDEPESMEEESESEVESISPSGLLGLDEAHSALARLLLSRPEWTRSELGDAAGDLDLMIDGAIETLNEAAFDKYDVPFTEGETLVIVNPELLEKIEV